MEELNIKGHWWLPDNPEKKVFGVLSYSPAEGGKLDLVETLEVPMDKTFRNSNRRFFF